MSDLNKWTGIGRLTRDAETKHTAGGMAICSFAVAVNRRVKKGEQWEEQASFFDVEMFGKRAESIGQYLVKGKQVGISGELAQDRWTDGDGQNRSKVKIIADDVQLLGGNAAGQSGEGRVQQNQQVQSQPDDEETIPF